MKTRRCPLCDTPLDSHTCPKCAQAIASLQTVGAGTPVGERTLRDPNPPEHKPSPEGPLGLTPEEEKAAWYAAAGKAAPSRDASAEGSEESDERRELHRGFGSAAAILLAQAVAGLLVLAFGGFPDPLDVGVQVVVAVALLFGVGVARFGIVVAALLHLLNVGTAMWNTGSPAVLLSAGPSLCLLGAYFFRQPLFRGLSAALGVLLAFGWLGVQAHLASQPAGSLADFALEQSEVSDANEGWALRVPRGVTLFDGKLMNRAVVERRAELLGAQMTEEITRRGSRERLLFSNSDGSAAGGLISEQLPSTVDGATLLPSLGLLPAGAVRDDSVVPTPIREDPRLSSQGWRSPEAGGTRDVMLVRTQGGSAIVVHCLHPAGAGEILCREILFGLSISARP